MWSERGLARALRADLGAVLLPSPLTRWRLIGALAVTVVAGCLGAVGKPHAEPPQNVAPIAAYGTYSAPEPDPIPTHQTSEIGPPRRSQRAVSQVETVVQFALAQVGKPYVWAAAGPNTYDCSGLVLAAYARVGVRLPHYTGTMLNHGRPVPRTALRRGDLVFPSGGHVGIALGDGRMVHAANPGQGVIVSPIYGFWTARRIL